MSEGLNNFERMVLTELAAIRTELLPRIAVLEKNDKDILGNGQPGRMKSAEDSIEALEKKESRQNGIMWTVGVVWTLVLGALELFWRRH